MAFQPNDYLTGLNLDFDQDFTSMLPPGLQQQDFDLFGLAGGDFLSLEAAPNHEVAPVKPVVQLSPLPLALLLLANAVVSEDKRKRNTAALARFRIKKKMKEQEMERRSKELEEKVAALEKKLKQLEMENKCLKTMITQRNDKKNDDLLDEIKRRLILDLKPMFTYTS